MTLDKFAAVADVQRVKPILPHRVAWIESPDEPLCVRLEAGDPRSAVVELIERIYAREATAAVSRARSLLRLRIYTNRSPSEVERQVVKLTAKRLTHVEGGPPPNTSELRDEVPPEDFKHFEAVLGLSLESRIEIKKVPQLLRDLVAPTEVSPRWKSDRPVGALLLDAEDRPLAWARNTNGIVRTRHAEWNLCEALVRNNLPIPVGSRLFASLKPCRMCAARILSVAMDPKRFEVVYMENDPGRFAQATALDDASTLRPELQQEWKAWITSFRR